MTPPLFTPPDVEKARKEWKATCGPTAAAAVMRRTCADVRKYFPWFPKRKYTSVSDMENVLLTMGASLRFAAGWPTYGIALIIFAIPGQPLSVRNSHWVCCAIDGGETFIYDFNLNGWWSRKDWEQCAKELCDQCGATTFVLHRGYEVTTPV